MSGIWPIIMDGHRKHKDAMFYVRRNDGDILIMSNKYIDVLRTFLEEKLSGVEARTLLPRHDTMPQSPHQIAKPKDGVESSSIY